VTRALSDQGLAFAVPLGGLATFVVGALVAGSSRPLRRLDVLRARQHE
jgi:hypothetical protein